MSTMTKFSSQIEAETLDELRKLAQETDRSLSRLLTEAVQHYLRTVRVRPAFADAVEEILEEHGELLERLAR